MAEFQTDKMYLLSCPVHGRQYWQADDAWPELSIGKQLLMVPEGDNPEDPWAVALYYCEGDKRLKLGYIPAGKNRTVFTLLSMGWSEAVSCTVSRLDPTAEPDSQIHFTVSILRYPSEGEQEAEENPEGGGVIDPMPKSLEAVKNKY